MVLSDLRSCGFAYFRLSAFIDLNLKVMNTFLNAEGSKILRTCIIAINRHRARYEFRPLAPSWSAAANVAPCDGFARHSGRNCQLRWLVMFRRYFCLVLPKYHMEPNLNKHVVFLGAQTVIHD